MICLFLALCMVQGTFGLIPNITKCSTGATVSNVFRLTGTLSRAFTSEYIFRIFDSDAWLYFNGNVEWSGTVEGRVDGLIHYDGKYFFGVPKPFKIAELKSTDMTKLTVIEENFGDPRDLSISLFSSVALSPTNQTYVCYYERNRHTISNGVLIGKARSFRRDHPVTRTQTINHFSQERFGFTVSQHRNTRKKRDTTKIWTILEQAKTVLGAMHDYGDITVRREDECYRDFYNSASKTSVSCADYTKIRGCIALVGVWCKDYYAQYKGMEGPLCMEHFGEDSIVDCVEQACPHDNKAYCAPEGQVSQGCMANIYFMQSFALTCAELAIASDILKTKVELLEIIAGYADAADIVNSSLLAIEKSNVEQDKALVSLNSGITNLVGWNKRHDDAIAHLGGLSNRQIGLIETNSMRISKLEARVRQTEIALISIEEDGKIAKEQLDLIREHSVAMDEKMKAMDNETVYFIDDSMSYRNYSEFRFNTNARAVERDIRNTNVAINESRKANEELKVELGRLEETLVRANTLLEESLNSSIERANWIENQTHIQLGNVTSLLLETAIDVGSGLGSLNIQGSLILVVVLTGVLFVALFVCIMCKK